MMTSINVYFHVSSSVYQEVIPRAYFLIHVKCSNYLIVSLFYLAVGLPNRTIIVWTLSSSNTALVCVFLEGGGRRGSVN